MTKSAEPKVDEKVRDFLHSVNSLDFGPLAYKLMYPEDRPGLSFEQTIDAITKYKGFLFLYHANPGKALSPSRYIDYVWHTHILDTELYFAQTAILFGNYLHHFPFFGKRDAADEKALLAAADFTKAQAASYFGWDDDDWCGNGHRPRGPRRDDVLTDLVSAIFPGGLNRPGTTQDPETITIQTGNFRHTVEHLGSQPNPLPPLRFPQQDSLVQFLKLPLWVIVCYPVDINTLNQAVVIQQRDSLGAISKALVEKRLTPAGFSGELVQLQIRNQAV